MSNIVIWPDYPRFPGPIFFNVTVTILQFYIISFDFQMDVNEELPIDKIEMDLEVETYETL